MDGLENSQSPACYGDWPTEGLGNQKLIRMFSCRGLHGDCSQVEGGNGIQRFVGQRGEGVDRKLCCALLLVYRSCEVCSPAK